MGVFFGGVFVVLIPLAVRDLFAGGAQDISAAYIACGIGTLISIVVLTRRGGVAGTGRALAGALLAGSAALCPLLLAPMQSYKSRDSARQSGPSIVLDFAGVSIDVCGPIEEILTHLGLDPRPPPRGRASEAGHAFAADCEAFAIRGARHGLPLQRCSWGGGCAPCPTSGQSPGSRPRTRPAAARSPAAFTPGRVRMGAFASCSPPPMAFAAPAGPC